MKSACNRRGIVPGIIMTLIASAGFGCSSGHWFGQGGAAVSMNSTATPALAEASPETLRDQARRAESDGDLEAAIELYRQARSTDPDAAGLSHRIAVLHARQRDAEQAVAEFERALEETPRDVKLLNDYGFFLLEAGRLEQAEATLRQALRLDRGNESVRTNLALVLAERGDYIASRKMFVPVVGEAAAWSNVGAVMARKGDWDAAESAFRQASAADPKLPQPHAFLGYAQDRHLPQIVEVGYDR
jgi:Flp pilus assembly protein TadD